jgi:diacylglycerol kinase (ATP)
MAEGVVAKRFGLLYAAVGFAGEVGKCTTPTIKRVFGARYCYSVGFFRALCRFESPHMRVCCDDREFEGDMFLVSAGNAEIVGGGAMRLSPGARIDDGKLNVNIVHSLNRIEITRCFPKLLMGTHVTHPRVEYFTATRVKVESEPALEIQIDGELFGQTPATFEVKPGAIRVCTGWGLSGSA